MYKDAYSDTDCGCGCNGKKNTDPVTSMGRAKMVRKYKRSTSYVINEAKKLINNLTNNQNG